MLGPATTLMGLAAALVVAGCAAPPPPQAAAPQVTTEFDGRYTATVQAVGGSVGLNVRDCAAPGFSFEAVNGSFRFSMPHPHVATATPSLRESATPVYEATIAPDGAVRGMSNQNSMMQGRVEGARMTGQINGLLCYYDFVAVRR